MAKILTIYKFSGAYIQNIQYSNINIKKRITLKRKVLNREIPHNRGRTEINSALGKKFRIICHLGYKYYNSR